MKFLNNIKEKLTFPLMLLSVILLFGCESEVKFPSGSVKPSISEEVYAESYLSKTQIFASEKARLTLNVRYPDNVVAEVSDFAGFPEEFQLIESGEYVQSSREGIIEKNKWYDFQTDTEGVFIIPGFEIIYTEEGQNKLINTPSVYLQVFNEDDKFLIAEEIRDIKKPYKGIKKSKVKLFAGVASMILILAISVLVYFLRLRKKDDWFEDEKLILPHKTALEKYSEVKKNSVEKGLSTKEFCSEVSAILKDYIIERWNIEPLQMTSSEIITKLRQINEIDEKDFQRAEDLISLMEVIKFTSVSIDDNWSQRIEEYFLSFINNSREINLENLIA